MNIEITNKLDLILFSSLAKIPIMLIQIYQELESSNLSFPGN
jgi:hypothetical protein